MPKVKPKLTPGPDGRMPTHSFSTSRGNTSYGHGRDRATVNRLHMYRTKAFKRDRHGDIIEGAGDLTSRTPEKGAGRTAPNRKWFGNVRTVKQQDLANFRDAVEKVQRDPYALLLKQKRLPMGLIANTDTKERALAGTKLGLLANESYEDTFTQKRMRKRPRLAATSMKALAKLAQKRGDDFEDEDDNEVIAEGTSGVKGGETDEGQEAGANLNFDEYKDFSRDPVFDKGQSKRIWGELHKVIDSSDVVIQVLDARDPMGTRCTYLENFMRRQCPHKHMILLLNKCDLVPTWATAKWRRYLSREYPTLVFHSSVTNSFGKGSLINLLRQFRRLHMEKKSISCGLVGYPNVGKSSVINTLRGKKVANVAPIPGETKVWQYVTMFRSIYLIDCPGVVHDSVKDSEEESVLKGVVRIESLKSNAADYVAALLARVEHTYMQRTYGIASWTSTSDFLEKLARKSGKLLKRGEPDLNTVARSLLQDFQRGKLPWFASPPDEKCDASEKEIISDKGSLTEGPKKT